MKELINITTNSRGEEVVSARELHGFLEIETRFDIWCKRMIEYGFTQDVDYQCLNKNVQTPTGGNKNVLDDYALTINMSKHISMIQRSEKGKEARDYFIACENNLKKIQSVLMSDLIQKQQKQLDSMALIIEEKLDVMQKQIERLFSVKSYHQEQIAELRIKTRYAQLAYNHPNYMSLSEYAEKIGETCPTKQRSAIARELKERSKTKGYEVLHRPTIGDSKINLYHIDVMKDFFAIAGKNR